MWEYKRESEKRSNYSYKNYLYVRDKYWYKDDDIADSINYYGNFTLTKEEKKEEYKDPYDINNYKEIRNIIDFIAEEESRRLHRKKQEDLLDDYMWLDNYEDQNNINLKVLINQMIELKDQILKLEIEIKYYKKYEPEIKYRKKHELYIKKFQNKLDIVKNQLKSIRKETMKNYGYNKKTYEKYKKIMTIKIMMIKIMTIK